jgi:DNA repair exonuclease SbcCD ATPase subunit
MKLTKISIRDLGCISYRVVEIGPDGNEIKGPCGTGKSTIGDAIEMTLTGMGISKDAIRQGADRAELLAHFDDPPNPSFTARQTIPREGSPKLVIRNDEGDTRPWQSPREKMLEKFGRLFDPSEFLKASKARRLEMLAEIVPMPVTAEDLERWTGEACEVPAGKFGLEVIDEVRAGYETKRTEANKIAAKAKVDHATAFTKTQSLDRPEYTGVVVPLEGEEDLPLREAERARDALAQRKADAEAMAAKTQGTRDKIAKLREEAAVTTESPSLAAREHILGAIDIKGKRIAELKAELVKAEEDLLILKSRSDEWQRHLDAYNAATETATKAGQQADELESTLASATIAAPTEAEIAAAGDAVTAAMDKIELIRAAREAHDACVEAARLAGLEAETTATAKALQGIVDRLTKDAPAEMVERSKAIPGLSVIDGAIFLDGVSFDRCGGAEKIDFVVDLAKRANPMGKLIKVDEVGSMDDQTRARFYERAIEGGWSLIAIRPWCDPEKDITEPVIVPIKEAVAEVRGKKRVKVIMPEGA